jgi:hypothetical protein
VQSGNPLNHFEVAEIGAGHHGLVNDAMMWQDVIDAAVDDEED